MIRIFLDSSVLFSAAYSAKGHSRDLLILAAREEITLVVSNLVLEETRRNLSSFAPDILPYLDQIIEAIPFEYVRPNKREVIDAAKQVELKDASIVAAARKANVDFLVTLDKKHLLGKPKVAEFAGIPIITPQEVISVIRNN
jgi:predicted nucleic acid-binding protein